MQSLPNDDTIDDECENIDDEWLMNEKRTHTQETQKEKKKKKKTSDASHGQLAFRLEYLIAPCFFFFFFAVVLDD